MDGTLIDSSVCVERKWRSFATRHGLDPATVLRTVTGRTNDEALRQVAPRHATASESAWLVAEEESCRDGIRPLPGARALLSAVPRSRWAVVTSAWRRLAEIRFGCAKLPLPEVLVTADDVRRGKPDPLGYLTAANALAIPPRGCVVVEDSPVGIAAARAAAMRVIAVASATAETGADWTVPDFTELRITHD